MPLSDLTSPPGLTNEFCITLPGVTLTETHTVPNEHPPYPTPHRIAIIGEAPGKDECREGKPFVGASGRLLFGSLRRYGINRADCLIANVSQSPIPDDVKRPWHADGVAAGLSALAGDLAKHQPHAVLLLGNLALKAAFPSEDRKVTDWRGSILRVTDPVSVLHGYKVIPCIHPAAVFRDWSLWPLLCFDLERFAQEAGSPSIVDIPRNYELDVSADRAIELLGSITNVDFPVALDIEGGVYGMSCVSFATSPSHSFIVPLAVYSDSDKRRVLRALYRFLSSSTPKILQNQLYDNFVLSYAYRSPIRNVVWDTMLSGHEIYPELPKGLGTQTSIWTRHPFYKMDRKSTDRTTLHRYCCTDSLVTYEIYEAHRRYFQGRDASYGHFRFNMSLLPALLYMEQRGINYDKTGAAVSLTKTSAMLHKIQTSIDAEVHKVWVKHGSRGPAPVSLNVNSPKQVADVLYKRFGYPAQHPKKGREVDTSKVTTNVDALLELRKRYNGADDAILELILQYRKHDGIRETLEIKTDKDSRVRCGYNIVGTETGRLTCYGSPTGSGANLTTITKSLRRLYVADRDHWMFQCDLAGADGWTVAAHCALRGDSTMWDDYVSGIKPAKVIVLMLKHGAHMSRLPREELKRLCDALDTDGKDAVMYLCAKKVQHGTNYGLGTERQAELVLKDSYKDTGVAIVVSKHDCQRLQDMYMARYPGVRLWQRAVEQELDTTSTLSCASGHLRKFFGRARDKATYREGYAHEPQANTTYATNLALSRLWTDPENRRTFKQSGMGLYSTLSSLQRSSSNNQAHIRPDRLFVIEPLHHVHDALIGQFHKDDTDWAVARIRTYFDNPITIAGRTFAIPFEGWYGNSWGELGQKPDKTFYPGGRI